MRKGRLILFAHRPLLAALALCTTLGMTLGGCGPGTDARDATAEARAQLSRTMPGRTLLSERERDLAAAARVLPPGTKSVLRQGAMRHGSHAWNEEGVPPGTVTVWVDLRRQMASVFRGGHEIGTAVIQYGAPGYSTPVGGFPVLRKVADYHSRSYDAPMPHSLFITDDGVALHGSPTGARRATHGCVGLPVAFAERLFGVVAPGDRVTIVESREDPAAGPASDGKQG